MVKIKGLTLKLQIWNPLDIGISLRAWWNLWNLFTRKSYSHIQIYFCMQCQEAYRQLKVHQRLQSIGSEHWFTSRNFNIGQEDGSTIIDKDVQIWGGSTQTISTTMTRNIICSHLRKILLTSHYCVVWNSSTGIPWLPLALFIGPLDFEF